MKSIDIKSLLIGILGTALVMVLMGQSSMSGHGRYSLSCLGNKSGNGSCFILDTIKQEIVGKVNALDVRARPWEWVPKNIRNQ